MPSKPVMFLLLFLTTPVVAAQENGSAGIQFFEKEIRPILVERCYECHSARGKTKGGLRLDTRKGVRIGGDSGAAIVPGEPDKSLLVEAIRYKNRDLQMPPKNSLSPREMSALEKWIQLGAPDPRLEEGTPQKNSTAMTLEEGRFRQPRRRSRLS
jgi:mono/diheme cytochrome c family protein